MKTKTVEWMGVVLVARYTDTPATIAYDSVTLQNPEDLQRLLDNLLVMHPCEEHLLHVLPALSSLAAVLEPPMPQPPSGTMMN